MVVGSLAAAFLGGGYALHAKSGEILREVTLLREHLETTRQQAAMLARHTRELHEAVEQANEAKGVPDRSRSGDFAVLSALVRDIADSVAELDRRGERVESEIARLQGGERPRSGAYESGGRSAGAAGGAGAKSSGMMNAAAAHASPSPAMRENPRGFGESIPAHGMASSAMNSGAMVSNSMASNSMAPNRVGEPSRAVRQLVAAAIASDRFDVYLQRIVDLPQRRIRGYDVTLRPDGSDLGIANSEIRAAVEAVGHQLAFDRKLIIQTVRLARVFEKREREVLLFADISQRFLMSEAAFDDITALIEDAPLAPQRIILCLPQRFFAKAVAFEHEALRKLSELGFRFLVRDVESFDFDLAKLARAGVRWIRAGTGDFLAAVQGRDELMEVAASDFIALLERRKISFIAEHTADEESVAELLDLSVEFAQGPVFAPPQAVRADVLETSTPRPAHAPPPVESTPAPERRGLRDLARRA